MASCPFEATQPLPSAPNTKLPYYDLKARGYDAVSAAPSEYHTAKIGSTPIYASTDKLLQGFAAFVSAVAELEELAFVAQYAVEGVQERRLATAKVAGLDKPRTYTVEDAQVSTFKSSALDGAEFDFEIQIGDAAVTSPTPRVSQQP